VIGELLAPASQDVENGGHEHHHPIPMSSVLPVTELEAFQELRARAAGKLNNIPAEVVASHVLAVTRGADWPVQRAALDAIVRRAIFARRDDLVVSRRREAGSGWVCTNREAW